MTVDMEDRPVARTREFRAVVVQMGARRGYDLAKMLHAKGHLSALLTDACWHTGEEMSAKLARAAGVADQTMKRRTASFLEPGALKARPVANIAGKVADLLTSNTEARYRAEDWLLGRGLSNRDLDQTSVLVNSAGNGGLSLLRRAKSRGVKVVTDVIITPKHYSITRDLSAAWPHWEETDDTRADEERFLQFWRQLVDVSDLLLCPSARVEADLIDLFPTAHGRTCVLPYTLGDFQVAAGEPEPKTVLFVGAAGVRKGIPYLGQAATLLKPKGYRFLVVGPVAEDVPAFDECKDLDFLGKRSRDDVSRQMAGADVFCLPSFAEGQASVTLEALSRGLPLVVSRESGAPIEDGIHGRFIEPDNPVSIARAIEEICEDRGMRGAMSTRALEHAGNFTLDAVGSRLIELLQALTDGVDGSIANNL